MKTRTQLKTESFADLKARDRIKIFKSDTLEYVLDVDTIDKRGADCYIKNQHGTRRVYLRNGEFKFISENIAIYNFGNRNYGNRIHIKLILPRDYEWRKI